MPFTGKHESDAYESVALDVVGISKAVGDQLRANILKALAQDSFAVLELGEIFATAQPAMSHHLKKLAQAGLVSKRREGTSIFYQRSSPHLRREPTAYQLFTALYEALDSQPLAKEYQDRITEVHQARVAQSQHFFTHQADALANQTALICDPSVYADCVLESITNHPGLNTNRVLEIGPGSGVLLSALASQFNLVVGVDNSAGMLAATHKQVAKLENVSLLRADFADMPADTSYDVIVAAMVIHHLASPEGFFKQAARLLDNSGMLVIAELCDHTQAWVKDLCGDVWLGFSPQQLTDWSGQAGFKLHHEQFLAQRNGFRVQVSVFTPGSQFNPATQPLSQPN
jgi:2-polyprenyl-3-methyl-5-hydroxy-6-metoxy-1,4-benzoquinol methylase